MKGNVSGKKLAVADQFTAERDYWLQKLDGELSFSSFPADFPDQGIGKKTMDSIEFTLEDKLCSRLLELSNGYDYTLHMLLMTGFVILLERFTGNTDVVVGMPVYKQEEEEGEYINTVLALRNQLEADMTFKDLLLQVRQTIIEAVDHQNYPLETLVYKLDLADFKDNFFLFDTTLMLDNIHDKKYIEHLNLNTLLSFNRMGNSITGIFEYNSSRYKGATMERLIRYYQNILNEAVFNVDGLVDEIEMMEEQAKNQLLFDFNQTQVEYPEDQTIISLFEEQVEKRPDHIAVAYNDETITYAELNRKANQLANLLRREGVEKEELVGLMIERSIEMIVGILAIMKAGAAYLPLDFTYPEERIRYMIQDSQMKLLLISDTIENAEQLEMKLINLNDARIYEGEDQIVDVEIAPHQMAYMIYTSGSTGNPKGVMVEHYSIVNTLLWRKNYYDFTEQDATLQLPSFAFDSSVEDIFTALISGAKLVMIDQEKYFDLNHLENVIKTNHVTHFLIVPNFYQTFLKSIPDGLKNLRVVTVAGESFSEEMVKEHFEKLKDVRLCNEYGPTENSVCTTIYDFTPDCQKVLIGKPIDNVQCYILDQKGRVTPIGVPAELCVSGRGVTRGYYQRPELTAEKFVENPFVDGERVYRTGDLARWTEDGNIEFLGRVDQQIKIRGFRVELGEIESKLLKHNRVREAVVVVSEGRNKDKCLAAYVVLNPSAEEERINASCLKDYLLKQMPDYMVPQYIKTLDEMPLLPNGKINKKALPEPTLNNQVEYEAPRDEVEEKLAELWAEVLEINKDQIGIHNDFFDMGGHSLKATTFVAKVFKKMNVKMQLSEIFEAPTIKEIANIIRNKEESMYSSIQPVEEREYYPLSSAQKRLFILEQFGSIHTTYNVPQAMIIEGKLDLKRMEDAFRKFIDRHESLRTSFELVDGNPVQRIHQRVDFAIDYQVADSQVDIEQMTREFVRPFDLSKAPLLRARIIKLPKDDVDRYLFTFDMHHIITDGVSMSILVKEILDLYQGKELQALRIQYKDFAVWQNELFESGKNKEQEEYWLNQFSDEIPVLNLPTDYQEPAIRSFAGDTVNMLIEKEITEKLNELAEETKSTLYMVLLAAYTILLAKYSGQEDIVVGSPIAGRGDADLQDIMGMFVNTLAMRNYPATEKTFLAFLAEVKERAVKAFENQDYPFERLVEQLDLKRQTNKNPLFDVMFVLQNMSSSSVEIDDVKFIPYTMNNYSAKFDLTLTATEIQDEITCTLEYSTKLFKEETMQRMKDHFIKILKEICSKPEIKISEIEMIDETEKQELMVKFNDTEADYPKDKLVHQLFEEQVELRPDQVAVSYNNEELTYSELNCLSNQLARYLVKKGVGPESIVPIVAHRSLELIIGTMAVLKAGGAYLPVDPDYPEERIRFMLEDALSSVIITLDGNDLLEGYDIVDLKRDLPEVKKERVNNLNESLASDHLMYVIYTSGSTGNPKGVMIEHRSFVNMIYAHRKAFGESSQDKLTQVANFSFDAFCLEVWPALTVGAELYLADEITRKDPAQLKEWLIAKEITQAFVPTPMGEILISETWPSDIKLKSLLMGGDKLHMYPEHQLPFNIYNLYGPTEATVFDVCYQLSDERVGLTPPIGKPIDNVKIYILDDQMNPVAVGVKGEIYIGGEALARGYLNRPDLTKIAFMENPFVDDQSARLYKTGDLGYYLPDGSIVFTGRKDNQVKIRGFRIELGEIEASLLQHQSIKEAVVIDNENNDGSKYLAAYYVADEELPASEMKVFLTNKMPGYMIPTYLMQLDKLPLTANGKIDRKALPKPDGTLNVSGEYLPPKNEVEEKLVAIWSEILEIDPEKIGVQDSFFDLGGNSLRIIKLNNQLKDEFDQELEVVDLFNYTTIEEIAGLVAVTEEEEEVAKFTF